MAKPSLPLADINHCHQYAAFLDASSDPDADELQLSRNFQKRYPPGGFTHHPPQSWTTDAKARQEASRKFNKLATESLRDSNAEYKDQMLDRAARKPGLLSDSLKWVFIGIVVALVPIVLRLRSSE